MERPATAIFESDDDDGVLRTASVYASMCRECLRIPWGQNVTTVFAKGLCVIKQAVHGTGNAVGKQRIRLR